MEKRILRLFSFVFHPLIITVCGLLIIYNSGTSLSVLQTDVKRISIIIVGLFTFVFPLLLIIALYFSRAIKDPGLIDNRDRILALSLIFIFYLFTFIIIRGVPQLTNEHTIYLACAPLILVISMLVDTFLKNSLHMAGIGMLLALLLVLVIFFGASIQFLFICIVLLGGMLGTSRLILELETAKEVVAGFMIGFLPTVVLLTIYAF